MKPELSVLNRRRKTNGIKRRKVAHGDPDITGTWGKGPAPSGAAERRAYSILNHTTCIQYGRGKAENTVRDTIVMICDTRSGDRSCDGSGDLLSVFPRFVYVCLHMFGHLTSFGNCI